LLFSIKVRRGGDDKLHWIPSRRGLFDERSYYNVLVPMITLISLGRVFGGTRFP
jgi:hypothetical protein